jgi:hypothetical protein
MNTDTIYLTPNISLFQVKKSLENPKRTSWELYIQNKKENKSILLDSLSIHIPPPNAIISSDNSILEIPKLLSGLKDNNDLYAFIFKEKALWLYKYNFISGETFECKRIKIFNMLSGSVDNFGEAKFDIVQHKVSNEDYFYISHNRVLGEIKMIVKLDTNSFKINKLIFSEPSKIIKDEEQLFRTLDLEQNKEKVSEEIKKVLIENNLLKQNDNFKYLGNIDLSDYYDDEKYKLRTTGYNYFFYKHDFSTKIIRYDNDDNEWLLGDYKEEEIKEE